jgi:hypothetical protein
VYRVVALALVACGSSSPPPPPPHHDAAIVIDHVAPPLDACVAPVPAKIENGTCDRDADCVLTDLAAQCDACNLERTYPTRKRAFDGRLARCAGIAATTTACGSDCPKHDLYTGAFYRAECREHRCIAWRYHSGG